MELPGHLEWVELDLPEILGYKEARLGAEKPRCALERIAVDLSNVSERRKVFASIATRGKRAVILNEGNSSFNARTGEVSKRQSPMERRRTRRIRAFFGRRWNRSLVFNFRFANQHHWDVVANRIDAAALAAL